MNEQKPPIVIPALIGGVFLGVTSALPLIEFINCACCALVIGGGVLASVLYLRDYPGYLPPVSYAEAAVLGLLTGVIGGGVWTTIELPLEYFEMQIGMGMMDMAEIREALDDPNIPPALGAFLANILSHGGMTLGMAIFSFFTNLIFSVIFATLGAIIGVAIFQKKPAGLVPPTTPGPPPPVMG